MCLSNISLVNTNLFSSIVKQGLFVYVIQVRIRSWNQPVLRNQGKLSCPMKQRAPLMGLELKTDSH